MHSSRSDGHPLNHASAPCAANAAAAGASSPPARFDADAYREVNALSSCPKGRVYTAVRVGEHAGVRKEQLVVVKVYYKAHAATDEARLAVLREIACMRKATDAGVPNVLRLIDAGEDSHNWYIVTNYTPCPEGDLYGYLHNMGSTPWAAEDVVDVVLRPLLAALDGLHKLHICHRDIKPENILLAPRPLDEAARAHRGSRASALSSPLGAAAETHHAETHHARAPRASLEGNLSTRLDICGLLGLGKALSAHGGPWVPRGRQAASVALSLEKSTEAGTKSEAGTFPLHVPRRRRSTESDAPSLRFRRALLADLGMAIDADREPDASIGRAGTLEYQAPEVLAGAEIARPGALDVWALGVLAFELLAGVTPFESTNEPRTMGKIAFVDCFEDASRRARIPKGSYAEDFIQKALAKDPEQRPTVAELLAHPFVAQT